MRVRTLHNPAQTSQQAMHQHCTCKDTDNPVISFNLIICIRIEPQQLDVLNVSNTSHICFVVLSINAGLPMVSCLLCPHHAGMSTMGCFCCFCTSHHSHPSTALSWKYVVLFSSSLYSSNCKANLVKNVKLLLL